MDYSPHREIGGTLHLPSPTFAHHIDTVGPSDLRRSLSRSPSKPQRHLFAQTPTRQSASSLSPLSAHGGFSPHIAPPLPSLFSIPAAHTMSHTPPPPKKKLNLSSFKRPLRTSRIGSTRSPMRRALGDASHQGNITPTLSRSNSGEENNSGVTSTDSSGSKSESEQKPPLFRFDSHNLPAPVKFDPSRPRSHTVVAMSEAGPARSSLLKRSDGDMHLGQSDLSTPIKRRSIHGGIFAGDADVFNQSSPLNFDTPIANTDENERPVNHFDPSLRFFGSTDLQTSSFSSPVNKRNVSTRKSNRHSNIFSRSRGFHDSSHDGLSQSSPVNKARHRSSMDASLLLSHSPLMSRPTVSNNASHPVFQQTQAMRSTSSMQDHQPHPLSRSLVPSSSGSNLVEDTMRSPKDLESTKQSFDMPKPPLPHAKNPAFSKSLPIGALRPNLRINNVDSSGSYNTPAPIKSGKHAGGYMSTGLISKRNRNPDYHPYNDTDRYVMPDTPSKRASFPPVTSTPFANTHHSVFANFQDLGTPLPSNPTRTSITNLFRRSANKGRSFGQSELLRRSSFISDDGEDRIEKLDSHSSADELPPTPTKANVNAANKSKPTSLRSSIFGRRTSLGPDTFLPIVQMTPVETEPPPLVRKVTPIHNTSANLSPQTPQTAFTPPDAGFLSVTAFRASTNGNVIPATPTAQRDNLFGMSVGNSYNEFDTSITSRFHLVETLAQGEFSIVYKVEKPVETSFAGRQSLGTAGNAWVVKKAKRPYMGARDRQHKLREVNVLRVLRGKEHILEFKSHWETNDHLYIQTEFCENGNLSKFLAETGNKARLDDFRIWKILLELSLGVKAIHQSGFIHLDLKPANVFISFDGSLKIGDFGLASPWPAPEDIDGEGDREYISPEVLKGRFDKPADVFAIGLITLEIAGNFFLPDNGDQWQRLRSGDLSDIPSLTWSTESQLDRDDNGDPIEDDSPTRLSSPHSRRRIGLEQPPAFMHDHRHPNSLDHLVEWMLTPAPEGRPTAEQVATSIPVQWISNRRRAGATVYEGNWGPADHVLQSRLGFQCSDGLSVDVEMSDV